jgi:Cysteine-rich secretory protein family
LINDYRQTNGLGKLQLSDTLTLSSERHSQDMGRYRYFAHHTVASSYYPVGASPGDRIRSDGYNLRTVWGENIAVGCGSAERCFELWRNSPSHNAAMLDGNYRVIGIARVQGAGPIPRWYWTTDFGGAVDSTTHAPGESPPAEQTNEREARERSDGAGLENGEMSGDAVWREQATDHADLILDGHARLGDYDNGRDELRQKIHVRQNTELAYEIRITADEPLPPFDRLLVRLTNEEGKQIDVLEKYGGGDAGGWRHDRVDLSRFAGRTVYLSFLAETDAAGLTAFYVDEVVLREGEP